MALKPSEVFGGLIGNVSDVLESTGGLLAKMIIVGVDEIPGDPNQPYIAQFNPKDYKRTLRNNYKSIGPLGQPQDIQVLDYVDPEKLSFIFKLDGTGASPLDIPGIPGAVTSGVDQGIGVAGRVAAFVETAYNFNAGIHTPRRVRLIWGTSLNIIVVAESLTVNYTLFNTFGTPIRADMEVKFIEARTETERQNSNDFLSPDLTKRRIVKQGDTLSLLTFEEYGDARFYLEVARVNNLTDINNLVPGTELIFPPVNDLA